MHIHHLALRVRDFEKSLHFTRRSPSSRFTRSSPRTAALLYLQNPTAKPSWSWIGMPEGETVKASGMFPLLQ